MYTPEPLYFTYVEIFYIDVQILEEEQVEYNRVRYLLRSEKDGTLFHLPSVPLRDYPFRDPEGDDFDYYAGDVSWVDKDGEHHAYAKFCPYDMETDTGWLEVFALVPTERTGRKNKNPRRCTRQDGDSF